MQQQQNNDNLFQNNGNEKENWEGEELTNNAGHEIVTNECLLEGNEYILEIKPIVDVGVTSCCGLSNLASIKSFIATYNNLVVASMKDGIVKVGKGGSSCEVLPKKQCKRTVGCGYDLDTDDCYTPMGKSVSWCVSVRSR